MKIFDGQKGKRCDEAEYLSYTHKHCNSCGEIKEVSLFYRKNTKTARGWAWDTFCIDCRRADCRDYGQASKVRRNARLAKWRKTNPKAAARNSFKAHLRKKYGITPDQLEEMRTAQGGKCAICDRTTSRLFVDHCHTKGHVRSLLCQTCNTLLGWYERKASEFLKFQSYVEKHRR